MNVAHAVPCFVAALAVAACFPPAIKCERGDNGKCIDGVIDAEVDTGPLVMAPTGLAATTTRAAEVELTWDAVVGASGYRAWRCEAPCADSAGWESLGSPLITDTRFIDDTAKPAATSADAPTCTASGDRAAEVFLSWPLIEGPRALRYHYRVTALYEGGESAPSTVVIGHRADWPIIAYEVQVDDGPWSSAGDGTATAWTDTDAPAPTLETGTASASEGTHATHVALAVTGARTDDGAERRYRCRAVTAYSPGQASAATTGRRAAKGLQIQWERSAEEVDGFEPIGATGAIATDPNAPADGAVRWYRVRVSADSTVPVVGAPVRGWRQGAPNVPGGVSATGDLEHAVRITWGSVSGAIGYHVYRDGERLTSGTGVVATSYDDLSVEGPTTGWSAPSDVSASTHDSEGVTVAWTAPARPFGPEASYVVRAVNEAGEGPPSAQAIGRRAAPTLVGYDIEATPAGGNATWFSTGDIATTWRHANPPRAAIVVGQVVATQGMHRNFVRLTSSGASLGAAPNVAYRVRGVLQGGASYTPTSTAATGRRAVGALQRQWQRSAGNTAQEFQAIAGATAASRDDTGAPINGDARWYRLELSATGAEAAVVGPVEGWRLAIASVTGGGHGHTCAVAKDGRVWCWGRNDYGQLGRGTEDGFQIPQPTYLAAPVVALAPAATVAARDAKTCTITTLQELWCWGKIGYQNGYRSAVPVKLPLAGVQGVSIGYDRICAVDGSHVWCWGTGILGNNSELGSQDPVRVIATPPALLTGAVAVDTYEYLSCARLANGQVRCWGGDGEPSLVAAAPVTSLPAVSSLSVDSESGYAVTTGGAIWTWLHVGQSVRQMATVAGAVESCGGFCVRTTSGGVACWGPNDSGQLGRGTTSQGWTTSPVLVLNLGQATALGCDTSSRCAVVGGGVKCWGYNGDGQLGDGTTTDRSSPVDVVFP